MNAVAPPVLVSLPLQLAGSDVRARGAEMGVTVAFGAGNVKGAASVPLYWPTLSSAAEPPSDSVD